jgi:hypothetical protein
MKSELSRIANVQLLKKKAIISLISNVKQSSAVLEKVLQANHYVTKWYSYSSFSNVGYEHVIVSALKLWLLY